jgi:ubiquinone/menaquinone biosynthesis C-methylase UbiE
MQDHGVDFFEESIRKIFRENKRVIDIGGGLRLSKSNRHDASRAWLTQYMDKVDYKVIDKVADYNPDIVGDIHDLPFSDNSLDAIICMAVIEHVEDPKRAVEEIYRVLKPGGYAFISAPFLFYYHPLNGYYGDFFRFTVEGMKYLTRQFTTVTVKPTRGPLRTLAGLIPFFSKKRLPILAYLDKKFYPKSNQASAYQAFCIK